METNAIEKFIRYKHVRNHKTDRLVATFAYIVDAEDNVVHYGWAKVSNEEQSPKKTEGCKRARENMMNQTPGRSGVLGYKDLNRDHDYFVGMNISNIRYRIIEVHLKMIFEDNYYGKIEPDVEYFY